MEIFRIVFEVVKWIASGGWGTLQTAWPHIHVFLAIGIALFGMYYVIIRAICPRIDRLTGVANTIATNHLPHIEARIMEGNRLTRVGSEMARQDHADIREAFKVNCPMAKKDE